MMMKKMIRRTGLCLVLPALFCGLAGCDSTTALDEVSLIGTWGGVGSLQTSDAGRGLTLEVQSHVGGAISGRWTRRQETLSQGTVSGEAGQGGAIRFTLGSFPGDDPTFDGRLTDQHRMSGTLDAVEVGGSAVFRRRSVSQP